MKIGRGHRHVAQARDMEHVEVVGILRDVEATLVDRVAPRSRAPGSNSCQLARQSKRKAKHYYGISSPHRTVFRVWDAEQLRRFQERIASPTKRWPPPLDPEVVNAAAEIMSRKEMAALGFADPQPAKD